MAEPHAAIGPPLTVFLATTIARLEHVVAAESARLALGDLSGLAEAHDAKSHALLALTQAMRTQPAIFETPDVARRMRALRAGLTRNADLLSFHIDAVGEVAAILAEAIRAHEADGTYGPRAARALRVLGPRA